MGVPGERAAKMLGVRPKTVRYWDEQGMIGVVCTPGGRRPIPEGEIQVRVRMRRMIGAQALPMLAERLAARAVVLR